MKYLPVTVAIKSIILLITAKVFFDKKSVGQKIMIGDREYSIFRYAVLKNAQKPKGMFRVWFTAKMSPEKNKILSIFTTIGFIGFPGWTSKKWLIDKNGNFGGIYEFDTIENAEKYQSSYAMKFSKWRSKEGCFRTEVLGQ